MALTDLAIRHARPLSKAYRLSDCHGLYIQVNPSGSKLWYLKFRFGNKENRMALGPYPLISLALAREKQADIWMQTGSGMWCRTALKSRREAHSTI